MNVAHHKKLDHSTAIIFALLTLIFVYLMTQEAFYKWAYQRCQNQLRQWKTILVYQKSLTAVRFYSSILGRCLPC